MWHFLIYSLTFVMLTTNDSATVLSLPVSNFHFLLKDMMLYLLLFLFICDVMFYRRIKIGRFYIPIIVILGVYYFFIPLGIYNGNSWKDIFHNIRQVNYLLIYFPLIIYFEKTNLKTFLNYSIVIIFLEAIITIILFYVVSGYYVNIRNEFYWIDYPQKGSPFPRILLPASNVFPLAIITLLFLRRALPSQFRLFIYFLLGTLIVALLFTFSRSLWLNMLTCIIFMFFVLEKSFYWKFKTIFNTILCLFLISLSMKVIRFEFLSSIISRFESGLNSGMMSNFDRINEAKEFLNKIKLNPIFGFGQGSTVDLYLYSFGKQINTPFSHNSYLIYLLNFGLIGTIIIVGMLIAYFIWTIKRVGLLVEYSREVVLGFYAGLLGLLVASLVTSNLTYTSGYFFLGVMFAIQNKIHKELKNARTY